MREVLLLCWRDTGHPQGGGSERYLERVGAELARRGVSVTLRTAAYPGAPREEFRDGLRISRGGGRFTVYPRALAAMALGRAGVGPLRGVRPDAVIDTQNGIPFFARLATPSPVAVLVHHCHREQWPVAGRLTAKVGWFIESRLSPAVHRRDQYLTVSLPSAEDLEALGVDADRVAVVRNGTDPLPASITAGSQQTRSAAPRLVVLSRLVPHKQIEDALDVVARLRGAHPGLHLDIVGGGWWEPRLRERAAELGVGSDVTFHGHVSEQRKHEILARAWVHVMPSRKEGWGITVVEAGQHGVPTVGYTSSRGLTDSIVDGATGLLVDAGGLADAVHGLLADPARRTQLGEKARIRAAEFSWAETGSGVERVLRAAVAGRRVGGLVPPAR
ncbi:glycosyltransferase family 4 protein [Tsukamurella sp. 8F]|uniref:glycosyltransferase family 4 protein n=1 Tax=unclassified Tsukamurella TaxID=2633480 RepID=UPI0023B9474F|nr:MULTISPECIES: glycosyltransferase family 4 protein [unclassified Tsukamurella]MDF0529885.1 glycosyltransferase family 4 protein [Tsukamurella sp. 8J]MDF0588660.1 glycosyltransferase family 4 protein [Tsukamurella sp. 8F]